MCTPNAASAGQPGQSEGLPPPIPKQEYPTPAPATQATRMYPQQGTEAPPAPSAPPEGAKPMPAARKQAVTKGVGQLQSP